MDEDADDEDDDDDDDAEEYDVDNDEEEEEDEEDEGEVEAEEEAAKSQQSRIVISKVPANNRLVSGISSLLCRRKRLKLREPKAAETPEKDTGDEPARGLHTAIKRHV